MESNAGCEGIGEAAVQAGCRRFFGCPITPQNEIPECLSRRLLVLGAPVDEEAWREVLDQP
jgi:pyruvate/2-oxoacid:ferredoxin oxidoreductase alpha subunit